MINFLVRANDLFNFILTNFNLMKLEALALSIQK